MTQQLVFLDTETTGLEWDADIWEIAFITRYSDGSGQEHSMFVQHDTTKCAKLPDSFRVDHLARYRHCDAVKPADLALFLKTYLDGAHIVGAVPNFDTERIGKMMRDAGHKPSWHYHLIDVEALAIGHLASRGVTIELPWKSDDLSRACGVEPPGPGVRHTAMGDAKWAMNLYDAIHTRTSVAVDITDHDGNVIRTDNAS